MLRQSSAYLAVRVANGLLALLTLYVLTRLMAPEHYGLFVLGLAAINVGSTIGFQWLNAALARFYAAQQDESAQVLAAVLSAFKPLVATVLAVTVLVALALWALGPLGAVDATLALCVGAGVVGMALHNLHMQLANARGEPLRYGLITSTRAAVALPVAMGAVWLWPGTAWVVAAVAVGCASAVAAFGVRWPKPLPSPKPELRAALLRFGGPLSLTYVSAMAVDVADRFLLASWAGTAVLAGYAAAGDLAQQTVGALLNVFFLAQYPRITAAWHAGGAAAARAAIVPLARVLWLVAPAVLALFVGLAPEIAALMFGPALRADAAAVLPWLAAAVTLTGLRAFLFDIGFHLEKASVPQLRMMVAVAVVNVVLNLLLIPRWGAAGAALAAAAAAACGLVASAVWASRRSVLPAFGADAAKALLLATVAALVLRASGDVGTGGLTVALRLAAAAATFGLLAWLLNAGGLRRRAGPAGPGQ